MKPAPAILAGAFLFALVALVVPAALAADGYLGVRIQSIDETLAAALDLEEADGVLVSEVIEDSPAEKAGLLRGDLILTINGRDAFDSESFTRRVRRLEAGETATIELIRKGERMTVEATLTEAADSVWFGEAPHGLRIHELDDGDFGGHDIRMIAPGGKMRHIGGAALGVQVHSIDEDLAPYFGTKEGVLVLGVNEETAAAKAGLKTGDVILSVDGKKVDSTAGLHEVLAGFEAGDEVEVAYLREKKQSSVKIELSEGAGLYTLREFAGPRGMREFHMQSAPRARQHYRMRLHEPEDLQIELQELKEQLQRLEEELERAESENG